MYIAPSLNIQCGNPHQTYGARVHGTCKDGLPVEIRLLSGFYDNQGFTG